MGVVVVSSSSLSTYILSVAKSCLVSDFRDALSMCPVNCMILLKLFTSLCMMYVAIV